MNRRLKILMLNILISFVLIFANLSRTEAATRSWFAGDLFLFSYSFYSFSNTTNTDFALSDITELTIREQGTYNITPVDLSDKTYASIFTDETGSGPNFYYDFGWEAFTTFQLNPNNFFVVNYDWDFEHNETVLTSFDFGDIEDWPFIESQWDRINTFMSIDMFNNSEIIDTVIDPFEPIIHNITFGDFMNNVESFSIMGKNTLTEAEQQFKNNTRKWNFEFDLSNFLMSPDFNFTLGYDIYYPYQSYISTIEFEYIDGGIIEKVIRAITIDITIENQWTQAYFDYKMVQGDFKSLEADFPYLMVIPAIFLVTLVIRKTRSKNNRRTK